MKKISLLQEPGFLWDLYFVFYLNYNFKEIFREPYPDESTKNFALFCKNILIRFGDFPEELSIFFKIFRGGNHTFIRDKYLKAFEENFINEYTIDNLQQELTDHERLKKNMIFFYLDTIDTDEANECLMSLEKLLANIKRCNCSAEQKLSLYEFFIHPMHHINLLQRTLIEKRTLLSDYYRDNYKTIIDAYDESAINELNNALNVNSDAQKLECYVSYCLIDKLNFNFVPRKDSYLYILGSEYYRAVENFTQKPVSDLEAFCHTLGERNRINILLFLKERGEITSKDLERHFNFSGSTAYHHISIMSKAGIVKTRSEGKTIFYSINKDHIFRTIRRFNEFL